MKNNIYENFSKEKFNKENNYKRILNKAKEEKNMKKIKVTNLVAVLAAIVIVACISPTIYAKIKWNIEFKEYQNREYETGNGTVEDAIESGYYENIQMDYVTQDNISVKVDSLIITDDYFESQINFKFSDEIQVDSQNFNYSFAVYDDENNIYAVYTRMHLKSNEKYDKVTPFIYEELGVKYNKNDVYAVQLCDQTKNEKISAKLEDRNIISKIKLESNRGFPKSKKLYIRIFDLGYYVRENANTELEQIEEFTISDAEWIFQINVPEKFYERETIELKLKDEIPGVEIEKIAVSEIGLVLKAKIDNFIDIIKFGENGDLNEWEKLKNEIINITDEEGNIYYEKNLSTLQKENWFKFRYDINKNMLNKKLFLNIKVNGSQYTSELIKK